jgi:hypothetical protein
MYVDFCSPPGFSGLSQQAGEQKVEIRIRSAENVYVDLPLPQQI